MNDPTPLRGDNTREKRPPNVHDWHSLYIGNYCRLCARRIGAGMAKAEHAKKHEREGRAHRTGLGTKADPYCYKLD
jgi:hypothetical protein